MQSRKYEKEDIPLETMDSTIVQPQNKSESNACLQSTLLDLKDKNMDSHTLSGAGPTNLLASNSLESKIEVTEKLEQTDVSDDGSPNSIPATNQRDETTENGNKVGNMRTTY